MTAIWTPIFTLTDTELNSQSIKFELLEPDPAPTLADVQTAMTALANAFAAASDAGVRKNGLSISEAFPTAAATDGAYADIEDKAIFIFRNADGQERTFQLPAPEDAIFMADEKTVDKDDALVQAIITALTTLLALFGQVWTYYRAYRRRAKARKNKPGTPAQT